MKRLIKTFEKYVPKIGDYVNWKKHPYDDSTYKVIDILENGNVIIDNGRQCYTDIKPSVIEQI